MDCDDDEEHAKDTKELFISEVLEHEGEPQKRSIDKFRCVVRGHAKLFYFEFIDCKFIPARKVYAENNKSLHYLKPLMVDLKLKNGEQKGDTQKPPLFTPQNIKSSSCLEWKQDVELNNS